jgi:hypothetical protein
MGSQSFEDYPSDTNTEVLSIPFGIGPSVGFLLVSLDDDTVYGYGHERPGVDDR